MSTTATVNTKVSIEEKERFNAIAGALGLSQSTVLRNFIKAFNSAGGFPYDVNYPMSAEEAASTQELNAQIKDGTAKLYSSMDEVWDEIDNNS